MPSFDVVSKVDLMELDNALNTAAKEITNRYDFRNTGTSLERLPEGIVFRSSDEPHLEAAISVLRERMAKRNVPHRYMEFEGGHDWLPAWLTGEALGYLAGTVPAGEDQAGDRGGDGEEDGEEAEGQQDQGAGFDPGG